MHNSKYLVTYVLVHNKMESIAPCWKDVVLQWSGAVVGVHHVTGLQVNKEITLILDALKTQIHFL